MQISKYLYKKSRWIHKYIGLVLLLFLAYMSITGIFLNHPNTIKGVSVPKWLVPKQYHPSNWNRSAMKGIIFGDTQRQTVYLYGRLGVFSSDSTLKDFKPFVQGEFPKSAWGKRTNSLYCNVTAKILLAATNDGLFGFDYQLDMWKKIALPEQGGNEPIQKIIKANDALIVVSKSNSYISKLQENLEFSELKITKKKDKEETISLFRIFLALHDGSIWGLPGRLVWDLAALVLLFLCISAFYIWFYPKKWKKRRKKYDKKKMNIEKKRFRSLFKYHEKIGWYTGILLIIIIITGTFLRPPLLISIAKVSIKEKVYPAIKNKNPWHKQINNALFDSENDRLILECKDGIWAGKINSSDVFKRINIPVRIFAMGATVFEEDSSGSWLIGSFGGLQRLNIATGEVKQILKTKASTNSGRPASTLVTGYLKLSGNKGEYILGHRKGICDTLGNELKGVIPMPQEVAEGYRMPLWNYFFEMHNARFFRGILGAAYILIIPLGGLFSLLIISSGLFDYWYVKIRKKRNLVS